MTNLSISEPPVQAGFWTRTWRAICAFDEALHYDSAEAQHERTRALEARIGRLETAPGSNPREAE